jgi:hypothetical protein
MKTKEELAAEAEAAEAAGRAERAEQARKERRRRSPPRRRRSRARARGRDHRARHAAALAAEFVQKLIKEGKSVDQARKRGARRARQEDHETTIRSGHSGVDTISDETVNRRAAMVDALLHRADPQRAQARGAREAVDGLHAARADAQVPRAQGRAHRGHERQPHVGAHLRVGLRPAEHRARRGQQEPARGLRRHAADLRAVDPQSFAPDFKNINRIQLSGAPSLLEIKSGGEYKRGVVTDGKETYALTTYGRILGINRQTIINDDMNAFTRLPALCARAAADLESDTVYGMVTANAALADSIALFARHAQELHLERHRDRRHVARRRPRR